MSLSPDPRQIADPFGEQAALPWHRHYRLLGADIEFASDSEALIGLVDAAYAGLPAHALGPATRLRVELRLQDAPVAWRDPPAPRMFGGAGMLGAAMDAGQFAVATIATGQGLVTASPALLGHPYHLRYELLEFVVYTLAARRQGLLPLHAGCVGCQGRGVLLLGASGAGKTTASLMALEEGLDFLTEDACFLQPGSRRATGTPNFLHLRNDAIEWLQPALRERVRAAPVIQRRSGVEKFELDLRGGWARLAAEPLAIEHLLFASPEPAAGGPLLAPLSADETRERLRLSQPLAAGRPGWDTLAQEPPHGWLLRRGSHPREAAAAIRALLMA